MALTASTFDNTVSNLFYEHYPGVSYQGANTIVSNTIFSQPMNKANISILDMIYLKRQADKDPKLATILHKLRDHINVVVLFREPKECTCDCDEED